VQRKTRLTAASSRKEVVGYLRERSNWGRWGEGDQKGALNLITPSTVLAGKDCVRHGRQVSLSRKLPTRPASNNPRPALHFSQARERNDGDAPEGAHRAGVATDFFGVGCHGSATTHIDALCHAWDSFGMWNGRDPNGKVGYDGVSWGGLEAWRDGVITRGILLDVPKHRGEPYVTPQAPVTGPELFEIADEQGVEPRPGDAVVVFSGRRAWEAEHGLWGTPSDPDRLWPPTGEEVRPGLDTSCVEPLREWDAAVLIWDMLDNSPNGRDLSWSVHSAISHFGVALVDNAELEPLAATCDELGQRDFLVTIGPLYIEGGTGSPVNPIAVL
jgi:hypothetical protein